MKILVHGHLSDGQHSLQRAEALARVPGVSVVHSSLGPPPGRLTDLVSRVFRRFGRPFDTLGENAQLLAYARRERPDIVLVENRSTIRAATLRKIRRETGAGLAYLSPDDVMAPGVRTRWLEETYPEWDLFFTTKTFNVGELRAAGVRRPLLIGNIYTPALHRPLTREEVGPEYESFDLVFVGQYEPERAASLAKLAEAGLSLVVYGPDAGLIAGRWERLKEAGLVLRPAVWGEDYVRALHHGKIVLGFLRKINRDRITQRSIEVPASARPLLAEKTEEHDAHLADGVEYLGFVDDDDLIAKARALLADPERRAAIAKAGRERCLASGYDIDSLARVLHGHFNALRNQ